MYHYSSYVYLLGSDSIWTFALLLFGPSVPFWSLPSTVLLSFSQPWPLPSDTTYWGSLVRARPTSPGRPYVQRAPPSSVRLITSRLLLCPRGASVEVLVKVTYSVPSLYHGPPRPLQWTKTLLSLLSGSSTNFCVQRFFRFVDYVLQRRWVLLRSLFGSWSL